MLRLYQTVSGASTSRLAYDGLDRIGEYDGANALLRRYVHGPAMDEPLVWYEGSGTTDRRFLSSDERGSIVSVTDSSGTVLALNKYDEYGQPQSTNLGAFGYTGQTWLPTMGVYYYKARVYDPELGRFYQTDPIGYGGGANLYAYVGAEPIGRLDPFGTSYISPDTCSKVAGSGITRCGEDLGRALQGLGFDVTFLSVAFKTDGGGGAGGDGLPASIAACASGDAAACLSPGDSAQVVTREGACSGHYNCEGDLSPVMASQIRGLLANQTFHRMAFEAWGRALILNREVAFGGIGFNDFNPTTGYVTGGQTNIYNRQLRFIANSGAVIYFHTHQNLGLIPGPSVEDEGVFRTFGFYGVIFSGRRNGFYFYDATVMRGN